MKKVLMAVGSLALCAAGCTSSKGGSSQDGGTAGSANPGSGGNASAGTGGAAGVTDAGTAGTSGTAGTTGTGGISGTGRARRARAGRAAPAAALSRMRRPRPGPDPRGPGPSGAAVVQGQHSVRRHAGREHQRRLLLPLEHPQTGAALHHRRRRLHRNRVRQPGLVLGAPARTAVSPMQPATISSTAAGFATEPIWTTTSTTGCAARACRSSRVYSEWITSAAYQRYLVTGDATQLKANLTQFISHYNAWGTNLTANITVNGSRHDRQPLFPITVVRCNGVHRDLVSKHRCVRRRRRLPPDHQQLSIRNCPGDQQDRHAGRRHHQRERVRGKGRRAEGGGSARACGIRNGSSSCRCTTPIPPTSASPGPARPGARPWASHRGPSSCRMQRIPPPGST